MTRRSLVRLVGCLALCLGVGLASVTYPEIPAWYASLIKPSWTPPNWAFPLVSNILYTLMGVSLWLLWDRGGDMPATGPRSSSSSCSWLSMQLGRRCSLRSTRRGRRLRSSFCWQLQSRPRIVAAWATQRPAGWLLVPYLAWVIYATSLNAASWR